ncbi:carbohydrate sulfotransferase 9-like [Cataglyphis hispanica]|uniref:carbohydrate sulfotransferase 9-like n=1 Tax=Cataglyphis hispanica TaxID=1086592 RepID=UPI00217FEE35|nr:carbohydrate sulfotransferase 9-like [Cataglyphis hispanica]XP_050459281.1 carbohydrate sulfotransferase 9-like [Cataglyphis hispanica]XP_050459282.1 carbohydrate sulfotransferase 9-like [Cataglyphis hispanica]
MSRQQRRVFFRLLQIAVCLGVILSTLKLSIIIIGDEDKPLPVADELRKLLIEAEMDNTRRLLNVERVCKKYNLGSYRKLAEDSLFKHPPAPQYSVFYMDRLHNISYCPVYKAGTTTWLYNLCLLMNVSVETLNNGREQLSTIARREIPELEYPEAKRVLNASRRLLIVRHPFERLLSAYRDKLENSVAGREHGTLHFYRKYGAKIVKKYRRNNFTKPRPDQVIQRDDIPSPAGVEPTFREFVDYVIDTDLGSYGDDHWMPYYLYCTPCLVKYNIIANVESLWRDQVYAINKLGLRDKIKPRWRHSNGHVNASRIYFRQLNRATVRKLYEKLRLDFELFDYSPDIYYEYATSAD